MSITTIQNISTTFDVTPYLTSRGWSLNADKTKAIHIKENEGYLEFPNYQVIEGRTYSYSINVESINNGFIRVHLGGAQSPTISTSGTIQGELTATQDSIFSIFSNANVTLGRIDISLAEGSYTESSNNTITWSEERDKWITFKSFIPENGFSMFTNLFTVKDGALWKHTKDATPNNFYGTQYHSTIKFQLSSPYVKTYHTIAVHGDKVFGTTEDGIQTQLGNMTDLITLDFETVEGIHYANKLRDIVLNDKLKGRYIVIELSDEETKEQPFTIFKIVVKGEVSSPNE